MLNHEMVVLAREYRNITQEQLARSVLVSQATIAKIEGGVSCTVNEDLINRIASSLKFPIEFFYQPGERLGFGSSAFYYRKRSEITAANRKRISGVVNLLRLSLKRLLNVVDLEANRKLPFFQLEEFGYNAEKIARALRAYWTLPEGPINNLTALIESAGVIVVPCDFGTRTMDGTSLRLTDMPPLIFINRSIPGDRWRFTLAHELAHLVMHDVPRETMENEADAFAAEFLMPEKDMRAQFARISRLRIQDLANLKPYWKVSIAALLMRADALNQLSLAKRRSLWIQMSKSGYRLKEPGTLPAEKAQNFENLFAYYRSELDYSVEELARTVFIFPEEFESLGVEQVCQKVRHLRAVQ